jgi:hypothetical protein
MDIEVLYLDGCPHVSATMDRLKAALRKVALDLPITETRIANVKAARDRGFVGSPTIRINGLDIEPAARQRTQYGIMCRRYGGGGVPSEDPIRSAIKEALAP